MRGVVAPPFHVTTNTSLHVTPFDSSHRTPAACHDIIKSHTPFHFHEPTHGPVPVPSLSQDRTPFVFDNDYWKALTRAKCDTAPKYRVQAKDYPSCTR
jgi:hypothetical protein